MDDPAQVDFHDGDPMGRVEMPAYPSRGVVECHHVVNGRATAVGAAWIGWQPTVTCWITPAGRPAMLTGRASWLTTAAPTHCSTSGLALRDIDPLRNSGFVTISRPGVDQFAHTLDRRFFLKLDPNCFLRGRMDSPERRRGSRRRLQAATRRWQSPRRVRCRLVIRGAAHLVRCHSPSRTVMSVPLVMMDRSQLLPRHRY